MVDVMCVCDGRVRSLDAARFWSSLCFVAPAVNERETKDKITGAFFRQAK